MSGFFALGGQMCGRTFAGKIGPAEEQFSVAVTADGLRQNSERGGLAGYARHATKRAGARQRQSSFVAAPFETKARRQIL